MPLASLPGSASAPVPLHQPQGSELRPLARHSREVRPRPRPCLPDAVAVPLACSSRLLVPSCPWKRTLAPQAHKPSNCSFPFPGRPESCISRVVLLLLLFELDAGLSLNATLGLDMQIVI